MSPAVSVVTPFFDTADLLGTCIESVLAQSFEDFEYILVDNHSTDGGAEIAARYASEDPRIKVLQPPGFLSQCDNFNFALQQISPTSTYCKMVLADDWLFPSCLTEMVALADEHPSIGLVSSYSLVDRFLAGGGLPVDQVFYTGRELARACFLDGVHPFGNNSTVMYRSDLVRAAPEFYTEATVFFDTDAAFRILLDHDAGFVHQVLSFHSREEGSLTDVRRNYSPDDAGDMIALKTYGPSFLTPEEMEVQWARMEDEFWRNLGRWWLKEVGRPADAAYWDYQRACLAAAGLELDPALVRRGARRAVAVSLASAFGDLARLKQVLRIRR